MMRGRARIGQVEIAGLIARSAWMHCCFSSGETMIRLLS